MAENEARQGFRVGGESGDLFKGTAAYYAAYRRPYPPAVVECLVRQCGLDGRGRLLDAGCGTGQVFQVLASHFDEAVAIDPDPDMVSYARQTASNLGLDNVIVRQARAEDLNPSDGPFRLAVFGASFHWTDRVVVADLLYDLLEPGGYLVVLSAGGVHSETTDWESAIRMTLDQYCGPRRRAGSGFYEEGERHEQVLARTRFGPPDLIDIPVHEVRSIDEVVGGLYSTSFASKHVLGDRVDTFERDLRQRLAALRPDGRFEKTAECSIILARR